MRQSKEWRGGCLPGACGWVCLLCAQQELSPGAGRGLSGGRSRARAPCSPASGGLASPLQGQMAVARQRGVTEDVACRVLKALPFLPRIPWQPERDHLWQSG